MAEPGADTRSVQEAPPAEETAQPEESHGESEAATPAEGIKSMKITLADLSAKGTALYAHKKYEEATDFFSRASDMQAELNGETAPENAEILFHYGRCLFKVGQSKSDVLGGPAAAADKKAKTNGGASAKQQAGAEAGKDEDKEKKATGGEGKDEKIAEEKKPLFQFTGDENFDDSEDEEEEASEEHGDQDDDDDLATAFEILDLARVCYLKQLDQAHGATDENENDNGKEVEKQDSSAVRHIKERLAETHDCLAEISLENERYANAIEDGRTSLNYKLELYPEDSDIIAEAHYKLSLALEFASVTVQDEEGKNVKREKMDQALRDEAKKEMELAIKSFRLKMHKTEEEIAAEDNELSRKAVAEMKEIIADMEQRLVDLGKDPISAQDLVGDEANPLGGLFGAVLGMDPADVQARVEEAKKTAVDLTSMVRKKAKDGEGTSNGKRKADEDEAGESKKARVEDVPDEE